MSENPRQFTSLDYADADMYGALTNKPSTATPLNLPLEDFSTKKPSTNPDPLQVALNRQEEVRRQALFAQQKNQQTLLEQGLREREIARNIALQATQSKPAEQPVVSSRDYENRLNLERPQSSTPERQPAPSTGRPAPTPNSTAARASPLVEPTATPPPAALPEPVGSGAGGFGALPRSLPQAAGRFAIPGAFAAGDFAVRVVQGQGVSQAASGAVASTAGAFAGAVVGTAIAGPVGEIIGGFIGGYIGGAASDYFFHSPPSTGTPVVQAPNYPPFRGGQAPGIRYLITCDFDVYQKGNPRQLATHANGTTIVTTGPIQSIQLVNGTPQYSPGLLVIGTNIDGTADIQTAGYGYYTISEADNLKNIKIVRVDGKDDYYPDQTAPAPPPDNRPYYFAGPPLNADNTIPSGSPAAGLNKGKNNDVVPGIPANNTPNGNGYFPGHGGLSPSSTPNPSQSPSNLGGNLPSTAPAPAPPPFAEPKDIPPPRFAPAPGGSASPDPSGSASPDPSVSRIENGVLSHSPVLKTGDSGIRQRLQSETV